MQEQYRHEAVPYEGQDAFAACCSALVDDAEARDERLMFLVSGQKSDALRDLFGQRGVSCLDADEHARNPALVMTLLDRFRSEADGRRCVGVTEPVGAERSPAGTAEALLGESVLNAPALQFWPMSVLCMYDSVGLDSAAIAELHRSHPSVRGQDANPHYEPTLADSLFAEALPAVPLDAVAQQVYGTSALGSARDFVRGHADELPPVRREDLVLAANELVTNSLQHGGGECRISMWTDKTSIVCDVRDHGHITDPMAGRLAAAHDASSGRGLWLANHLCDLVQIRSSQGGTTVRLHMDR